MEEQGEVVDQKKTTRKRLAKTLTLMRQKEDYEGMSKNSSAPGNWGLTTSFHSQYMGEP